MKEVNNINSIEIRVDDKDKDRLIIKDIDSPMSEITIERKDVPKLIEAIEKLYLNEDPINAI